MLATAMLLPVVCSCSSESGSETATERVPLQVELATCATRSAITGTTLPDGSNYGIFVPNAVNTANNVQVYYSNGVSKLTSTVYLSAEKSLVYAYYPYSASQSLNAMTLETSSQTDYLYGAAIDSKGDYAYVNTEDPKARIQMLHAMARVTFNITQDASDKESNSITYLEVGKVPTSCTYNLSTNKVTTNYTGTVSAKCNITPSTTSQSVDLLVLPVTAWDIIVRFKINDSYVTASIPSATWTMGQQYSYSVTLGNDKLSIGKATITPRENTTQSEIGVNGEYTTDEANDLMVSPFVQ